MLVEQSPRRWKCFGCGETNSSFILVCTICNKQRWFHLGFDIVAARDTVEKIREGWRNGDDEGSGIGTDEAAIGG